MRVGIDQRDAGQADRFWPDDIPPLPLGNSGDLGGESLEVVMGSVESGADVQVIQRGAPVCLSPNRPVSILTHVTIL
jgi:hypothetical protein